MTPEQFKEVRELFDRAMSLPPESRGRFLEKACSDDEIQGEVERLLEQETDAGVLRGIQKAVDEVLPGDRVALSESTTGIKNPGRTVSRLARAAAELEGDELDVFLGALTDSELREEVRSLVRETTPTSAELPKTRPALETTGTTLSDESPEALIELATAPYHIVRRLGEGGMGVVYEAEQESPVRRKVALKLIKYGMDSKQVVARFESERQALALMNHPNIANVYSAGTTSRGRPYFAMEFVRGIPVTEYCDKQCLNIGRRLELFVRICDGVQHAHQKGVIHRDIKPSNVLVAIQDDKPVPKIIDFGVAKATLHPLTERTLHTEVGQMIGTPEYMSPEQAEMSNLDIDTRSDVYSLGVLLYELLVGALPLDSESFRGASADELRRRVREEDPPTPSTRARQLAKTSGEYARSRRIDPKGLERKLEGDLDWIVMKALEKDRTRRYETANALALDVQCYLSGEPVRARKPSAAYLLGKLARRHRAGVLAGLLIAGALVTGTFLATMGLIRARRAEDQARAEAAKAIAINQFLQETLGSAHPVKGQGKDVTVLEALGTAVEKAEVTFASQPEIKASIFATVGKTYLGLGRYPDADPVLRAALELRRRYAGRHEIAESLTNLGALLFSQGDYAGAEPLFREALDIRQSLYGTEHIAVSESLNDIAMTLQRKNRDYEAAEPLLKESLEIRTRLLGAHHPDIAQSLNNLAMLYYRMEDYDRAETLFRQAIAMNRELFGEEHPELSTNLNNLGLLLRDKGEVEAAEDLFLQVLVLDRKLLGNDHPYVATTLRRLGRLRSRAGAASEAEELYREALDIQRKSFPEDHHEIANTQSLIGASLASQGLYDDAQSMLLEAHQIIESRLGNAHPATRASLERIVRLYESWDRPEKAAEYRAFLAGASEIP